MSVAFLQIDSFSAAPFAGNPAGVCLLSGSVSESWMAAVARETNLPATAFLSLQRQDGSFNLRWFTAHTELELCGHGTLASAHALYEAGHVGDGESITFQTRGGALTARRADEWIELDFPVTPPEEITAPAGLLEALGVEARYVGRGRLDCLVEVADESVVRSVRPDLARLAAVKARGVIVTSRSATPDRDFVSRFFAPSVGIAEDPVTGSAHCCLAPFWAAKIGRPTLVAHQLSSRGGVLKLAVAGDRVRIAGQAVTILRGELC